MDELDFTSPRAPTLKQAPPAPIYNAAVAMEFFRHGGKPEAFAQGATIFAENEKASRLLLQRDKMYLLLAGEVNLVAKNRVLGTVKIGEIFGEMAAISDSPRSATAVAKTACSVLSIDERSFHGALQKKPEFALMLMGLMIARLRAMLGRAGGAQTRPGAGESTVFDKALLAALAKGLGEQATVRYTRGASIFSEGQAGLLMYVVVQGRVAIAMKGVIVQHVGPGGVFGEMALVDQAPRMAGAAAETDCTLLALNRQVFLNLVKAGPEFAASLLAAVAERVRAVAGRA